VKHEHVELHTLPQSQRVAPARKIIGAGGLNAAEVNGMT